MARQSKATRAVERAAPASREFAPVNHSEETLRAEIARLAYHLWQARGCPEGSPEQDWIEAEQTLVSHGVS